MALVTYSVREEKGRFLVVKTERTAPNCHWHYMIASFAREPDAERCCREIAFNHRKEETDAEAGND